jgi:hypothetical protein
MGVFYEKAAKREPSRGICYGCRHAGDKYFSTSDFSTHGHCCGKGDLDATDIWPGFVCTCDCRGGRDAGR